MNCFKTAVCFLTVMTFFSSAPAHAGSEWAKEVEMPAGDSTAGRAAFMRFECYQCHRVEKDPALPSLESSGTGPVFSTHPDRPKSMLDEKRAEVRAELDLPEVDYLPELYAMAIMSPSHSIAPGFGSGSAEDEPVSAMPDYDTRMTVRELRDIVAYLTEK